MAPNMLAGLLLTIVALTSSGCNSAPAPLMSEASAQHTCSEMKVHGLGPLGMKEDTVSEVCKAALSESHKKCVKEMSSCTSEEQCNEKAEGIAISVGEAIATTCIGTAIFNITGPGGMMGGLAGAMGDMMSGLAGAMGDVGGAMSGIDPSDMTGGVAIFNVTGPGGMMGGLAGAMGGMMSGLGGAMGDVGGAMSAIDPSDMMGGVAGAMGDMGGAMGDAMSSFAGAMGEVTGGVDSSR